MAMLVLCTGLVIAQEEMMKMPEGPRGSYLKLAMQAEQQIVSLAEAVPQDKYSWRPMEGVRSMSESFMHAASGNYLVLQLTGGTLPAELDLMSLDNSQTEKGAIVTELKRSFKMLREHISMMKDDDLKKEVDFFGNPMTVGDLVMFAVAHQRETLGQEIAYARVNKIVPPWTAKRMEEAKKMEEKKK